MKNIPLLIGTIVGTLIFVIAIAFMFSGGNQVPGNDQIIADQAVLNGKARNVKIVEDVIAENTEIEEVSTDSGKLKQKPEIVTIVEFSDFQCPACKDVTPLVESVLEAFPEKVRLIYRHFPLDAIHHNARRAAIASEAVASINKDKFWEMHDLLFQNQSEWSGVKNNDKLNDVFVTYAEKLDIDRTQFLERIEDNSIAEVVLNDSNVGTQLEINSTPTFYVNGVKVSAHQLFATVESLIVSTE